MRNRLRGTLLSAAAGVAAAAAPSGGAVAQTYPTVTPGVEPVVGRTYGVPPGALPPADPAAMAQALPPGMPPSAGMTPGMIPPGMRPGMIPPGTPAGYGGPGPGLLPDSLRPYPRISPYDHRFDQTFHDGNLWMREANNSPRRYHGSVSYTSSKFRSAARTTIGARRSLDEVVDELFAPDIIGPGFNRSLATDTINTIGTVPIFLYVKSAFIPDLNADGTVDNYNYYGLTIASQLDASGFPITDTRLVTFFDSEIDVLDDDVSPDITTVGDFPDDDGIAFDAFGFSPLTGDVFGSGNNQDLLPGFDEFFDTRFKDADNPGIRGRFGFEEADGSGFEWTADYISEDADVYHRGDLDNARRYYEDLTNFDATDGLPGSQPGIVSRPDRNSILLPLGVIVVDVNPDLLSARFLGTPIAREDNAGFSVLPTIDPTLAAFTYDLLYNLEFSGEQAGTEMSFLFTPLLKKGRMRVRPSLGLRFNYVNESFDFTGLDSGALNITTQNGDTTGIFAPPPGPGIINPFTGSVFATGGDPPLVIDELIPYFPYQSALTNEVQSYLFGPQAGLHFDMEGKFLTLNSHVKAGVAGLQERIRVEGRGFNLNQHITGDLMPFRDQKTHSRLSPFVDFNVRGDLNLFPYVPVINRFKFLKNARFTGGFSATSFWEISRPLDAVIWREANSGNPFVNDDSDDRSQLYFTNWDLGVTWKW